MMTFQFIVDGETFNFTSKQNNKSIRNAIEQNYPNCEIELNYCMCIDACSCKTCSCKNSHYILTTKWISADPLKPWVGNTIRI